jgi:AI-2 transport protein TqsA
MSRLRNEQLWLMTGSLMILALYASGAILMWAQSILVPFVLAVLFVSLLAPLVDLQIARLNMPHIPAVTLTVIFFVIIAAALGLMLISAMETVTSKVTQYSDSFGDLLKQTLHYATTWGVDIDQKSLRHDVTTKMTDQASSFVMPAVELVTRAVLILVFVMFLLLGRIPVTRRSGIYAEIDWQIRHYIGVKVALSLTVSLLVWITLASLGLELAGVFALLTFLLNFIPVVGPVISTLLPIPMAVAQYQSLWPVVLVVAIPGAIQQIVGSVVEPKLLGRGLSLHPVTVVISLAIWGLLWGGAGMLLAVPITAILRIVLLKFESVRPIGRLLGGELPKFGNPEGMGLL